MSNNKNYYDILEIPEADRKKQGKDFEKVLKSAFHKLAEKYHPDKWVNASEEERKNAEEKFKEISEANDILSDPNKRSMFDQFGTVDANQRMYPEDEMFINFAKAHGFNMNMGNYNKPSQQVYRGEDVNVKLHLSVADLINKGPKKIKYQRKTVCSHCNGTGVGENGSMTTCSKCDGTGYYRERVRTRFGYSETISLCPQCGGSGQTPSVRCQYCNGTGLELTTEETTVDIQNGITDNTYIVQEGLGSAPYRNSGVFGNLNIYFNITPKDGFSISDTNPYDIICEKRLSVLDCITGGEVIVTSPDKKDYKINIPVGISDGRMFKLSGCGIYKTNGSRGDMIVKVKMVMPKKLDENEKKKIKELKNKNNFKIS